MAKPNKIYLGTNTKMYKTIEETVSFLKELKDLTQDIDRNDMELFVIPSYTSLDRANQVIDSSFISLGAQNMGWEEEGQFTGEISPRMLKEIGTKVIMAGHCERRHILGETDEEENKKVVCALKHDFTALLCIGETKLQKDQNISDEILKIQLKVGLKGVTKEDAKQLWIAYEPVWAIGVDGIPASKEYASEKHQVIKDTLVQIFGEDIGLSIPVLYGGSVNRDNAKELIEMKGIDGLFIGRSAWNATNFNNIIRDVMPLFQNK